MTNEEIVRSFKKRQKIQILVIPIAILGFFLIMLINPISIIFGFFIILGCLIITLRSWRCPNCNTYLGRGLYYRQCPKCKVPFRLAEEKKHEVN